MPVHTTSGGVRTWYDERGSGPPLMLLHGGFGHSGEFDGQYPRATDGARVLRQDRRGHGRTPDVPGPLRFDDAADDAADLLAAVADGPADLVGYSDGGTVALLVALRHPDLVRRAVCVSSVFGVDGVLPGMLDDGPAAVAGLADTPMAREYGALSPDGPEHFPEVAAKIMRMSLDGPRLGPDDLARVRARTLVVAADDDIVAAEHTLALHRGLPDAELAIVPGTSHALPWERPGLLDELVTTFLRTDPVPTTIPVRRAG